MKMTELVKMTEMKSVLEPLHQAKRSKNFVINSAKRRNPALKRYAAIT